MNDEFQKQFEHAAAFQRIWTDTLSKLSMAGLAVDPSAPPPQAFKDVRKQMFQSLTQSWEQFLRSPQFLEIMKQSMDNLLGVKKLTAEAMTKARHDTKGVASDDIDNLMLSIRHMEKRLLDRMETLEQLVQQSLNAKPTPASPKKAAKKSVKKTTRK